MVVFSLDFLLPYLLCYIHLHYFNISTNFKVVTFQWGGQFTIALHLTKNECQNGKMEGSNVDFQKVVEDMANSAVFNSGGVTAAIPLFTYDNDGIAAQKKEVHSEYRVLNKLKSNLNIVSDKKCLILYTQNSPCRESCLDGKVSNIIQPLEDVFRKVDTGYKAVVFDHIYRDDKMQTRERVFNSLKKIPVTTYCWVTGMILDRSCSSCIIPAHSFILFIYFTVILPGKLTENTFSFTATTWGIVSGERRGMNEPIVSWG
uniref:Uncharacterized protein n=1 Tax=Salmo trutta TaxID=8032 RepID=A0A674EPZ0_SALTR